MDDKIEEHYPDGKLLSTVPSKDGLQHGHYKQYYETGELMYEGQVENDNQEGLWKLYYTNGDIKRENIFKNHMKISQKEFYIGNKIEFEGKYEEDKDVVDASQLRKKGKWRYYYENGNLKKEEFFNKNVSESFKEWDEDGKLIKESISEIIVLTLSPNFHGDQIEVIFGSEIYFKEWKEGNLIKEELQYEYEKPENIKVLDSSSDSNVGTIDKTEDEDFWWNWNRDENKKYSSIKTYYDNGKLKMQSQFYSLPEFFRHASNREEVNKYSVGPLKEYFPSGNVKCEGNFKNDERDGLWIYYFETGKIKSEQIFNNDICESLKEWDEKGKLIKENLLKNGDSRMVMKHEVMSKGGFNIELTDGATLDIFGQRHALVNIEELYEDGEWNPDGDREEIDDFYLTGYEKGYLYDEGDLDEFFDIAEDSYPEWDFNGWSEWEETEEDWDNFKSKFPKVTSKEQFDVTS